jgi:acrylyl-CoA reductase (NADPH)
MAPMDVRERAWNDLGVLLDPTALSDVYTVEPLARVPELGAAILRGEIRGRIVVDVNA